MTILLEISPETEERLQLKAERLHVPLSQLLTSYIEQLSLTDTLPDQLDTVPVQVEGESFSDYLQRLGILGAVEGKRRADGKPWSEIEAACDPY